MKKRLILISLLILSCTCFLRSQVSLVSNEYIACDSMVTWIFIEPEEAYDTISSIAWLLNGETMSTDDSLYLELSGSGKYSVTASINSGQLLPLDTVLQIYSSPDVDFSYTDTSSASGYTYVFRSEGETIDSLNYNYSWYVNGEEAGNSPAFTYTFEDTGQFPVRLTVENDLGCSNFLIKNVLINESLDCPNVFTPNMDGYNDYFMVKTDGNTIYDFRVYSRTGLKVYHTESPAIYWDGRSLSGIEMRAGVYYYTIESLNTDASDKFNGFVHLLR
ncbi:MAG: gliding motility-associated C-terminal domain-containing protein [Bacteroidota bacterium]